VAALCTRERKDDDVTPAQLAPESRARSAGLGLDDVALHSLLGRRISDVALSLCPPKRARHER
jgi:hypothetical protein